MEHKNGVVVALVASLVIVLGWFFLSAVAAFIVTILAGAGVVLAALMQRKRGD